MKTHPLFEPTTERIDDLVRQYPFALVVSSGPSGLMATSVPLLLERSVNGDATLLGHFARSNPHVQEVHDTAKALCIVQGPHVYISPSWFGDRGQAPTWNFATVHFSVTVELLPSPADSARAVHALTTAMERDRPNAWHPDELGQRYESLLSGVIAFRAVVTRTLTTFKLGQNERLDVLADALTGLATQSSFELADAMRTANQVRFTTK